MLDKVMYFLKNLPNNKVKVLEESSIPSPPEDFIEYLVNHPIQLDTTTEFLSHNESNAR
jgi:hypothetical protein